MPNPYSKLPDTAFWRRAVARPGVATDPVIESDFRIGENDRVATAGSCFAQHLGGRLKSEGVPVITAELGDVPEDEAASQAYSAAYGNIYTVRQLVQLFDRAYATFRPRDSAWRRADGRWVDPFRPTIRQAGFPSPEAVAQARRTHLRAVRETFETCTVLVFTLGLTESWKSKADGAVFPIAPGVEGEPESMDGYEFENASVLSMIDDLRRFIAQLRRVNPVVRVLLTVSPVPLIATYEPRHVLVSTTASKAALRVVADVVSHDPGVAYFPSYEIITGPQAQGRYFAEDLRSITDSGVSRVMDLFSQHVLTRESEPLTQTAADLTLDAATVAAAQERLKGLSGVICDEELVDRF